MNYQIEIIVQVFLAFVVGVVIGFDRERSGKVAGIRTQMLVCVSSALLAAISVRLGDAFGQATADPARLMAQIVSGIGFLGAGVIIKNGGKQVTGVTTAATIWTTAAIGIGIGSGFYIPALLTAFMVLLLNPIAHFQFRYGLKNAYYHLVIKTNKRGIAEKAIKYLHLEEKERKTKAGETTFTILSSNQRNEMLSGLLEKKRVHYRLAMVED